MLQPISDTVQYGYRLLTPYVLRLIVLVFQTQDFMGKAEETFFSGELHEEYGLVEIREKWDGFISMVQ